MPNQCLYRFKTKRLRCKNANARNGANAIALSEKLQMQAKQWSPKYTVHVLLITW